MKQTAPCKAEIEAAGVVGFGAESKPTFAVGEVSDGPHLVQFALADKAYLFQLHHTAGHPFLVELLRSEQLIKAGFGLKSDGGRIPMPGRRSGCIGRSIFPGRIRPRRVAKLAPRRKGLN